jgi:AcrR family transcriptional regulator
MQVLKPEIRQKILNVSEKIFFEKSFQEASTREIAKKSGISVSNLYKYFKNKESLFYEVTSIFYNSFKNGLNNFFKHRDENFNRNRVELISEKLGEIIKKDRIKFVIVMEKSKGTKYENFMNELIDIFEKHLVNGINKEKLNNSFILHIIAKFFFYWDTGYSKKI